jgi:YHS domain-containing protein
MVRKVLGLFNKPEMVEDPVCHMLVDVKNPPGGTHEHVGQTYCFCSGGCRVAFSKEANAYLSGEKKVEM